MQLRKVCNHPNLFEVRPTISPFQCEGISLHIPSCVYHVLGYDLWRHIDLYSINLNFAQAEFHLGAYQCFRTKQRQPPRKLIMEMSEEAQTPPKCPPTRLSLKVRKHETVETPSQVPPPLPPAPAPSNKPNLKLKVPPNYGIQLVGQTSNASVLKCTDKTSLSFAGLVTTPTGKHILLTSNPNIPPNISGQVNTTGQKVTFLSKQPIATSNAGHQITKAYVKFQLTSVPGTTVASTQQEVNAANEVKSENKEESPQTITSKYLTKLYKDQGNSLDVRWVKRETTEEERNREDEEDRKRRLELMARLNRRRCEAMPMYGRDFHCNAKIFRSNTKYESWSSGRIHCLNTMFKITGYDTSHCLEDMLYTPERRIEQLSDVFDR